jgi:hypothetical protein
MRLSDTSPDVLEDLATTHGPAEAKTIDKEENGMKKTQRFVGTPKIPHRK